MKIYKIILEKKAEKFLYGRTQKERAKLLAKIAELPNSTAIKKMEGYKDRYRLRVGDYRVI